ncbi:unnamed protein product [Caenorhabditis auriculariae]|uniref:Uncharacterized protein n=1 Tax=Caenorhabditis auriculariae TaxID=2777116 RepID=A0A8S1GZQ2_9PELO|nr:unnamed protein product [Caenorhabditis auriculariae]
MLMGDYNVPPLEILSFLYPFIGIFVHCFELYLIIWKTPKFVQSRIPQAIRAMLAIPINFMTKDSGFGFSRISGLGEDWMAENVTVFGHEEITITVPDQFTGLIMFSPLTLGTILHIQYANLRCVTLDQFKKPLWEYRLNVGLIYLFSFVSTFPAAASNAKVSKSVQTFGLLLHIIYVISYFGSALKFSCEIWESFSRLKVFSTSQNARNVEKREFLAIQIQILAIPINFMTVDGGLGFLFIPELGDDWMNQNVTALGSEIVQRTGREQFTGLVWLSPLNLAAILHIQYANLRGVTLDEFKKPLWRYCLNVGLIYIFSTVSGYSAASSTSKIESAVLLGCLLSQYIYSIIYVGLTLKFSWDIWQNFSPWKGINISESTRKMQRKIFLAIQIQLLAIPINIMTQDSGFGFSMIPDLGEDWVNVNVTAFNDEELTKTVGGHFTGLLLFSPITLGTILHIQYANLRCVTLDEFKKPLWKYRLSVGFIYIFSISSGCLLSFAVGYEVIKIHFQMLAIPINFMTKDSGFGFSMIPDLGDDWMNVKLTALDNKAFSKMLGAYFQGLLLFSPITLATILHIQYANLRCVTLNEFKNSLWRYRLNLLAIPINFYNQESGYGYSVIPDLGEDWVDVNLTTLDDNRLTRTVGKHFVMRLSRQKQRSARESPAPEVRGKRHRSNLLPCLQRPLGHFVHPQGCYRKQNKSNSSNEVMPATEILSLLYPVFGVFVHGFELHLIISKTPKFVQSRIPQAIRALLAIPINFYNLQSGYGYSVLPDLDENWVDVNLTMLNSNNLTKTVGEHFAGLLLFSPIALGTILHIQYANLRCVTLDEFKKSLLAILIDFATQESSLGYYNIANLGADQMDIDIKLMAGINGKLTGSQHFLGLLGFGPLSLAAILHIQYANLRCVMQDESKIALWKYRRNVGWMFIVSMVTGYLVASIVVHAMLRTSH